MKIIVKSTKDNTETVSWKYSLVKPVYSDFFFFAQSPITQHAMAASTLHPVWLLRCHPTNQAAFPPSMRIQHGLGNWKNVYPLFCVFFFFLICGFVSQRGGRRKKKKPKETESQVKFNATQRLLHSSMPTLCQGGRDTNSLWSTCIHSHKHATANTHTRARAHTRLEADAVLISVTAAEPLAAQIAAGAQTMGRRECLHKRRT